MKTYRLEKRLPSGEVLRNDFVVDDELPDSALEDMKVFYHLTLMIKMPWLKKLFPTPESLPLRQVT